MKNKHGGGNVSNSIYYKGKKYGCDESTVNNAAERAEQAAQAAATSAEEASTASVSAQAARTAAEEYAT